MPLEIRQGDDLYQMAQWHYRRYSVGAENLPVFVAKLEEVGSSGCACLFTCHRCCCGRRGRPCVLLSGEPDFLEFRGCLPGKYPVEDRRELTV